jgi:DNA-binding LacI/PurR family transcriptional regulator
MINKVANTAGISMRTVPRFIIGFSVESPQNNQRVLEIKEDYGHQPGAHNRRY